jgi:predicted transposase YbfD/YdcC
VNREVHAPFWERPEVRFLRPAQYQQHWILDVQFGEDAHRTRKDHSAANLGLIRRAALNLLQQDTSNK